LSAEGGSAEIPIRSRAEIEALCLWYSKHLILIVLKGLPIEIFPRNLGRFEAAIQADIFQNISSLAKIGNERSIAKSLSNFLAEPRPIAGPSNEADRRIAPEASQLVPAAAA